MSIGQQAPGSYCRAVGGMGERMGAMRILLVQLQLRRHALLAHEHELAYATRLEAGFVPIADADDQ